MAYSTGNPERDRLYRGYIVAFGDDIDAIAAAAPGDFEVSADEVAGFLTESDDVRQPGSDLAFDPQTGMTIAPARARRGTTRSRCSRCTEGGPKPRHDARGGHSRAECGELASSRLPDASAGDD